MALGGDFDAIAVRIEHHALIVAVAGAPRTVQNRESVVPQPLGQPIDELFKALQRSRSWVHMATCSMCTSHRSSSLRGSSSALSETAM